MKRACLIAAIVLASSSAIAEGEPRAVTLDEARALARAQQPSIRAALARVTAARADASVPRSQWLPTVGLTAQVFLGTANDWTGMNVGSPAVEIPRIGSSAVVNASTSTFQPYGSTLAAIGVNQEVFDFGRIAAQSAAADAYVDVARHGANAVTLDVAYSVDEAFFAVVASKDVLTASNQAYERERAHRDLANAGVKSGLHSPIELTRAEADLAQLDVGRVRARGGVIDAQTVLAAATGATELRLDASGSWPGEGAPLSLAAAIDQAGRRDPRIAEALARVRAQAATTRAISAALRPNLWATGTFSGRGGGAPGGAGSATPDAVGWVPSVPNWDIGLVLSWPIYDGTVMARARASEAREAALRDDAEALRQTLTAAVQRAWIRVEIARDALPALQHLVDAAVANYAQADARFGAGLGTSVELADAEALRTVAEIDLARGKFELARARSALGRAIAEGLQR